MRWLGHAGIAVLALCAAVASFLVVAAPSADLKDRLIRLVEKQTGRTVSVKGGASFSIYPALGLRLLDVSLSGPRAMPGPAFLTAEELRLEIPVWPLLRRQIAIERLVLTRPVLTLRTDRNGARSWDFARPGEVAQPVLRDAVTEVTDAAGSGAKRLPPISLAALEAVRLGDVRLVDGRIIIDNEATQSRTELSAVSVALQLDSIRKPATITGTLTYNGETVPVDLRIASPLDLIEGRPSQMVAKANSTALTATFKGEAALTQPMRLNGMIDASSTAGQRLLTWLGAAAPAAIAPAALEKLAVKGRLTVDGTVARLAEATVSVGAASGTGDLELALDGQRPKLTATLALNSIVLDELLATTPPPASPAKAADPSSEATAVMAFDFSGFGAADLDATLAITDLSWRDIKIDKADASVTLRDRVLKFRSKTARLHGGRGHASLSLDARQPAVRLESNATFESVAVDPLLAALFDLRRLAGKGDMSMGVLAIGRNRREMLDGLLGQGRVAIRDGAVVGINLGQMVRALQQGKLTGWTAEPAARTDFSSLTGSVSVTKGIARNEDLEIAGPMLRTSGVGTLDVRDGAIDYAVRPRIVATLGGQGDDAGKLPAIEIPLRITGTIVNPEFQPDLKGIVRSVVSDPGAALRTLQSMGVPIPGFPAKPKFTGAAKPDLASKIGAVLSTLGEAGSAEAETLP